MGFGLGTIDDIPAGGISLGTQNVVQIDLGNVKVWPSTIQFDPGFEIFWEQGAGMPLGFLYVDGGPADADYDLLISVIAGQPRPLYEDQRGGMVLFSKLTNLDANPVPVHVTQGMTADQIATAILTAWNGLASDNNPGETLTVRHLPQIFIGMPGRGPTSFPPGTPTAQVVGVYATDATGMYAPGTFTAWGKLDLFAPNPGAGGYQPADPNLAQVPPTLTSVFTPRPTVTGTPVIQPPTVRIMDQFNQPVVGAVLDVAVIANAVVTTAQVTTNAQGQATIGFQAGATAGQDATVEVTSAQQITNLPIQFTVPVTGAAAAITIQAGAGPVTLDTGAAHQVTYLVTDAQGRPVSDAVITFTGDGTLPSTGRTGATGLYVATWRAPTVPGAAHLQATAALGVLARVDATVQIGPAAIGTVVSGDGQIVRPGATLADVTFRFTDAHGNPNAGLLVTFSGGATGTTNAQGEVVLSGFVVRIPTGRLPLEATAANGTKATAHYQIIADVTATVTFTTPDGEQHPAGYLLLTVHVLDQHGNAVTNQTATWRLISGPAQLGATTSQVITGYASSSITPTGGPGMVTIEVEIEGITAQHRVEYV